MSFASDRVSAKFIFGCRSRSSKTSLSEIEAELPYDDLERQRIRYFPVLI